MLLYRNIKKKDVACVMHLRVVRPIAVRKNSYYLLEEILYFAPSSLLCVCVLVCDVVVFFEKSLCLCEKKGTCGAGCWAWLVGSIPGNVLELSII